MNHLWHFNSFGSSSDSEHEESSRLRKHKHNQKIKKVWSDIHFGPCCFSIIYFNSKSSSCFVFGHALFFLLSQVKDKDRRSHKHKRNKHKHRDEVGYTFHSLFSICVFCFLKFFFYSLSGWMYCRSIKLLWLDMDSFLLEAV